MDTKTDDNPEAYIKDFCRKLYDHNAVSEKRTSKRVCLTYDEEDGLIEFIRLLERRHWWRIYFELRGRL